MFSLPSTFDRLFKRESLKISQISASSKLPMVTSNKEVPFFIHIPSLRNNNDLRASSIALSALCSIVANDLAYSIDLSKICSVIDA